MFQFLNKNKYNIYILIYLLIQNIKCNPNTNNHHFNKNFSFNEIYRIDTFIKSRSLSYINGKLELSQYKHLNNQFRIYLSEMYPYYYIELKSNGLKFGINYNNEIFLTKEDESYTKILWEIKEISPNQYILQNQFTKFYLEKYYKNIKCINDYYNFEGNKDLFKFTFVKLYEEADYKQEYLEEIEKVPIDIVIKYIDLSDKALNRTGIIQYKNEEENEELRYSVRSIFRYIPWFRKIYIIMPNEKVRYFKPKEEIEEKIIYIRDKDLIGFDSANVQSFLFNLYKMEKFGISENFIYMDDDYFIGEPLNKSDFFYYDEKDKKVKPCLINSIFNEFNIPKSNYSYNTLFQKKDKIHPNSNKGWKLSLASTENFLFKNYNISHFIYTEYTHNAIPMNIYDLKEIFKEVQKYEYINETLFSIQKHILSLSFNYFYNLYNLNIKHRKVHSIPYKYISFQTMKYYEMNYPLFVINTEYSKDLTPTQIETGLKLIKYRFPNPTKYEIVSEQEGSGVVFVNENANKSIELDNVTDYNKDNISDEGENFIKNNNNNESDIIVKNNGTYEKRLKAKIKIYIFIKRFYPIYCLIVIIIALYFVYNAKSKKSESKYIRIDNSEY